MTLASILQKKLANRYTDDQTGGKTIQHQGWNVAFRPEAEDALSCSLWDVTLEREAPKPGGDPRAWAERVSRKATGLLEPLKLVEVDARKGVALLRSAEPTPQDPGLDYHEVELHGVNRATVRRFRGFHEAGKQREQIPFAVTYEALAKLIDGVTAE
jgi:hypothetical protein